MRSTYLLGLAALLAVGASCSDAGSGAAQAQTPTTPTPADRDAASTPPRNDGFHWGPAPPAFPAGAEMAVLQGDPSVAGQIFTVRLRLPNGYVIPAHRHPTDEHVTVISGTLLVGMGEKFDPNALAPLRAGGFITAPANMSHFVKARGPTEVQVHAIGPFAMTYVDPADDPRSH